MKMIYGFGFKRVVGNKSNAVRLGISPIFVQHEQPSLFFFLLSLRAVVVNVNLVLNVCDALSHVLFDRNTPDTACFYVHPCFKNRIYLQAITGLFFCSQMCKLRQFMWQFSNTIDLLWFGETDGEEDVWCIFTATETQKNKKF